MSDYDRTMELVNTAYDAQGRSSQQFAKYADSVEYSVKRLSNTWEQFRVNLANNDFYKGLIDTANKLLETISGFDKFDWTKILIVYSTVGKQSVENFLRGTQTAINNLTPAFRKAYEKIPQKVEDMDFVQKRLTRYNPNSWKNTRQSAKQVREYNAEMSKYNETIEQLERERTKTQTRLATKEKWTANSIGGMTETEFVGAVKSIKEEKDKLDQLEKSIDRVKEKAANLAQPETAEEIAKKNMQDPAIGIEQYRTMGQAAGAAFTAAFTTAMLTDDPGEVFKATMISGATAAVPGIINTFSTALEKSGGKFGEAIGAAGAAGGKVALVILAIAALAAGIKLASKLIKEHNEEILRTESSSYRALEALEELKEKEEELGNAAYKTASAAEKTSTAYSDLADKTAELEKLQNKLLLTSEDQSRLNELSNEIGDIAPALIQKYDNEGNAVIRLDETYKKLLKTKEEAMLQDKLLADEASENLAKNQMDQAFSTLIAKYASADESQGKRISTLLENPFLVDYSSLHRTVRPASMPEEQYRAAFQKNGLTLNDQDFAHLGNQIKILSENIPELDFLESTNGAETIFALRKYYDSVDQQEWDKTVSALRKNIENFSASTRELEAAVTDYTEKVRNRIATELSIDSEIYQNSSNKNVQKYIQDYILNTVDTSQAAFEEVQLDWAGRENESEYWQAYQDWIDSLFDNLEIDEEQLEAVFTPNVISVLSQLGNLNLDLPELVKWYTEHLKDNPEILGLVQAAYQAEINAYNEGVQALANALGISDLKENNEGILESTSSSSNSRLETWMKASHIDDLVEKLNIYDNVGQKDSLLNYLDTLDSDTIVKIFDINWDQVATTEYEDQIAALAKATGRSKKEIQKIVQSLNLFDYVPASEEAFKDDLDERFAAADKYDKKIKAIQSASDSFIKNGKVSASALESLYDAGLSELINSDLTFNLEDAQTLILSLVNSEKERLEIEHQATLEYLNQLRLIQSITGEISAEGLATLGISPELINQFFVKGSNGKFTKNDVALNPVIEEYTNLVNNFDSNPQTLVARLATILLELDAVTQSAAESREEALKKQLDAEKAAKDAYEDILKKQQDVIDKQEELNKALYGDAYHKNKLDALYNYNTALEVFNDRIQEAKDTLDDLQGQNPAEFLDAWLGSTHNKVVNLQAQNDRYSAAVGSIESVLNNRLISYLSSLGRGISTNVRDYYGYNSALDRYEVNYGALNAAALPDDISDFVEEQTSLMNDYLKNIKKNQDELKNLEKEFIKYQKEVRDDYVSVQESIAKTLEDFYKQEVEDKKEMYEALEEADNKYLDALEKAIDKERKLRDQQDKWDSLATKEKRLSLLQRDTSGANQRSVQSLQKEIDKDRRDLLDNTVDTIIENLKELYEAQKETRDIELEYQENLLENSNYIAEANSLLQSWKTVDEMRDWMWAHTEDIDKMSDQAVEQLTEDWADMFDTIQTYNELTQRDIRGIFDVSANEVQATVLATSETLTSEADRAFGEVSRNVSEAIQNAEQAVADALKALADAQDNYNEKLKEFNKLVAEYVGTVGGSSGSSGGNSTYSGSSNANYGPLNEGETMADLVAAAKQSNEKTEKTRAIEWLQQQGINLDMIDADLNNHTPYGTPSRLDIQSKEWADNFKKAGYVVAQAIDRNKWVLFKDEDSLNSYVTSMKGNAYYKRYKTGGLANYTGPAWVDGTPSRPEAFLNADDTARIGEAANIFASLAALGSNGTLLSGLSQTIGDTNSQVNIYVESIATPEQVDYLIDRMKEEMVDAANPIGTSIILRQ